MSVSRIADQRKKTFGSGFVHFLVPDTEVKSGFRRCRFSVNVSTLLPVRSVSQKNGYAFEVASFCNRLICVSLLNSLAYMQLLMRAYKRMPLS